MRRIVFSGGIHQLRSVLSATRVGLQSQHCMRCFHASSFLSKEDYYKTLGIAKGTSKGDIKKKYFELAKQYHPDVNKSPDAEKKFKEISEAYEVLQDDQKRQMYDAYGHAGVDPNNAAGAGGGPFGGFGGFGPFGGFHQGQTVQVDPEEFMDMFEGMFGGRERGKGRDVQQVVQLSFFEAVNGCEKELTVDYVDKVAKQKYSARKSKKVKVTIPAGVDEGVVMRVRNEGGAGFNGPSGDLELHIRVQKDPYFIREGANVHTEVPITITKAILGGSVDVLTLTGMVEMKVPAGTQPDTRLILRGKGIKDVNSIHKGDQVVHLKIRIPKKISETQKKLLEQFENESKTEEDKKAEKEDTSLFQSAWKRLNEFLEKCKDSKDKKEKGTA